MKYFFLLKLLLNDDEYGSGLLGPFGVCWQSLEISLELVSPSADSGTYSPRSLGARWGWERIRSCLHTLIRFSREWSKLILFGDRGFTVGDGEGGLMMVAVALLVDATLPLIVGAFLICFLAGGTGFLGGGLICLFVQWDSFLVLTILFFWFFQSIWASRHFSPAGHFPVEVNDPHAKTWGSMHW